MRVKPKLLCKLPFMELTESPALSSKRGIDFSSTTMSTYIKYQRIILHITIFIKLVKKSPTHEYVFVNVVPEKVFFPLNY